MTSTQTAAQVKKAATTSKALARAQQSRENNQRTGQPTHAPGWYVEIKTGPEQRSWMQPQGWGPYASADDADAALKRADATWMRARLFYIADVETP